MTANYGWPPTAIEHAIRAAGTTPEAFAESFSIRAKVARDTIDRCHNGLRSALYRVKVAELLGQPVLTVWGTLLRKNQLVLARRESEVHRLSLMGVPDRAIAKQLGLNAKVVQCARDVFVDTVTLADQYRRARTQLAVTPHALLAAVAETADDETPGSIRDKVRGDPVLFKYWACLLLYAGDMAGCPMHETLGIREGVAKRTILGLRTAALNKSGVRTEASAIVGRARELANGVGGKYVRPAHFFLDSAAALGDGLDIARET